MCQVYDLSGYERTRPMLEQEHSEDPVIMELVSLLTGRPIGLPDFADAVLDRVKFLTDSKHGYISSVGPAQGELRILSSTTMMRQLINYSKIRKLFPESEVECSDMTGSCLLNNRKAFFTNDPLRDESLRNIIGRGTRVTGFLTAPATIDGMIFGQISLANSSREYTMRDLDLVMLIARVYALAVQRYEIFEKKSARSDGRLYRKLTERIFELENSHEKLMGGVKAMLRTEEMLKAQLREKEIEIMKISHRNEYDKLSLGLKDKIYWPV